MKKCKYDCPNNIRVWSQIWRKRYSSSWIWKKSW